MYGNQEEGGNIRVGSLLNPFLPPVACKLTTRLGVHFGHANNVGYSIQIIALILGLLGNLMTGLKLHLLMLHVLIKDLAPLKHMFVNMWWNRTFVNGAHKTHIALSKLIAVVKLQNT